MSATLVLIHKPNKSGKLKKREPTWQHSFLPAHQLATAPSYFLHGFAWHDFNLYTCHSESCSSLPTIIRIIYTITQYHTTVIHSPIHPCTESIPPSPSVHRPSRCPDHALGHCAHRRHLGRHGAHARHRVLAPHLAPGRPAAAQEKRGVARSRVPSAWCLCRACRDGSPQRMKHHAHRAPVKRDQRVVHCERIYILFFSEFWGWMAG